MADISSFLNKIKNAMFGKDVRGSLADGLEAVNKEVEKATELSEQTEIRQTELEDQYTSVVENAIEATNEANTQAIYAETSGNYADEKGLYASNQGDYAKNQGNHAKTQGDYAKQTGDKTYTHWVEPVATYNEIVIAYPTPSHGWTVMVEDTAEVYRYEGQNWMLTQKYNDNVVSGIQGKIGGGAELIREFDYQASALLSVTQPPTVYSLFKPQQAFVLNSVDVRVNANAKLMISLYRIVTGTNLATRELVAQKETPPTFSGVNTIQLDFYIPNDGLYYALCDDNNNTIYAYTKSGLVPSISGVVNGIEAKTVTANSGAHLFLNWSVSPSVESKVNQLHAKTKVVQKQVVDATINNVTGRSYGSLEERLNEEYGEVNAQLAHNANKSYVYMSDYAKGDGTDETSSIQKALNDSVGRTLYWNKQKGTNYLTGQLTIPSNIRIEFEPNTKVKAVDTLSQTSEPKEVLFKMLDTSNVVIEGNMAELSMNKAVFTKEHNHVFSMSGVTNVEIKNIVAKNSGGDGFWIGGYLSIKGYSERVRVINCIADNNRRNGLSITSGDDIYVENCTFTNASGADPQSGVDIEPNSSTDILRKIRIVNCKSINNAKEGFMVSMGDALNPTTFVDILFQNCYSISDNNGFRVKYIRDGVKGKILFKNCISESNEYNSFNFINCSSTGLKIEVEDCIGIDANTLNTSTGRNAGFLVEDSSVNTPTTVGNVHFKNCRYLDRRTTPTISYGFRIFPSLVTHKKFSFIDCYSEGQTADPFNFSNTATDVVVKNEWKYQYDKTATGGLDNGLHNGQLITNKGAIGAIKLTLKNAIENVTIQVKVVEVFLLKVFPVSTEQIFPTTTVGYGLTSSQKGASITLKGTANGTWEVVSMVGTWTESAT